MHYTVVSDSPPPPKKKYASSLTGDINPQSSHWNNEKMKIADNSAYIQIKTLNFTFAQQAVVVYFYLCSNFQEITSPPPIISECTLITSKKSIQLFACTKLLLLLVILVQT